MGEKVQDRGSYQVCKCLRDEYLQIIQAPFAGKGTAKPRLESTRYASFFGLEVDGRFLFLRASSQVIFGAALGVYCG